MAKFLCVGILLLGIALQVQSMALDPNQENTDDSEYNI